MADDLLSTDLPGTEPGPEEDAQVPSGSLGQKQDDLLSQDLPGVSAQPAGQTPAPEAPAPEGQGSDWLSAIKLGAKEAIAPTAVSKEEEQNAEHFTTGQKIARGVSSVVTDIGGTLLADAGAGAVVGSVIPGAGTVGGAIGGALYGLYKAYGQEKLSNEVSGEEFNPIRAALGVAANMNPLLRYGGAGLTGKLVKGVAQAGLQYGEAKAYGASDEEAGIGAAVGGAMAGAFHQPQERAGLIGLIAAPAAKPGASGHPAMNGRDFKDLASSLEESIGNEDKGGLGREVTRRIEETEPERAVFRKALDKIPLDTRDVEEVHAALSDMSGDLKQNIRPERLIKAEPLAEGETEYKDWLTKEQDKISMENKPAGMSDKDYMVAKVAMKERDAFAYFAVDPSAKQKLGQKAVLEKFKEWRDRINLNSPEGQAYMDRTYDAFKHQQAAMEVLSEEQTSYLKDFIKDPLHNRATTFMIDQLYAGMDIDHHFGTQAEVQFNELAQSGNRHTVMMQLGVAKQKAADALRRTADISEEDMHHLITDKEYRDNMLPKLGEDGQKAVKSYQDFGNWLYETGRGNGVAIDYLENYALQAPKSLPDTITAIRRQYKNVLARVADDPTAPKMSELNALLSQRETSKTVSQFLSVLEKNTGMEIKRPSQLAKAMDSVADISTIKKNTSVEAKAAFERKGEIPGFIQETNINRLSLMALQNMSKTINYRDVIRDLESTASQLHALGANKSRDYITRLVRDVTGAEQSGLPALANAMSTKWKVGIDKILDEGTALPGTTGLLKAAKDIPDLMGLMMYQIYPNFLGATFRAIPRELAKPILMTAPELGGTYGLKTTMKATGAALTEARELGVKGIQDFLQNKGLRHAKFQGESYRVMQGALQDSAPVRLAAKTADAWTDLAMGLYDKSDMMNRFIVYKAAEQLGRDLVKRDPGAVKWLTGLSEGYKVALEREARKGGDPGRLTDLIASHLNSKTQFNYGRQSLNEFGRALGPMFSMFTKWPVVMASEMRHAIKIGQADRVLTKYLAPWAALGLVGHMLPDPKEDPRAKVLLGYGGIKDWAPMNSVFNIGSLGTPPVVEAGQNLVKMGQDAAAQDWEKFRKHGSRSLLPFIPGYGVVRGLEQMETLKTGMNPSE